MTEEAPISLNNTGSRADRAYLHRDCIIHSAPRVRCGLICVRRRISEAHARTHTSSSRAVTRKRCQNEDRDAPEFDPQVSLLPRSSTELHGPPWCSTELQGSSGTQRAAVRALYALADAGGGRESGAHYPASHTRIKAAITEGDFRAQKPFVPLEEKVLRSQAEDLSAPRLRFTAPVYERRGRCSINPLSPRFCEEARSLQTLEGRPKHLSGPGLTQRRSRTLSNPRRGPLSARG